VATDLDRYGARLGRRFAPVRALLCSPTEGEFAVEAMAGYLEHVLLGDERDFPALVRGAQRLTQSRIGWLLGEHDLALDRFRLNETRSVVAAHLIAATQDAINTTCEPSDILPGCVRRAVAGTVACAHVQRDYKDDAHLHKRLEQVRDDVERALLRRLDARVRSDRVVRGPADTLLGNQSALLDLVVVGPGLGRAG
jgi:hypothetical protein